MKSHDYLTLITTPKRGNKLVTRTAEGTLKKEAGLPISIAKAVTAHVLDAKNMLKLLRCSH